MKVGNRYLHPHSGVIVEITANLGNGRFATKAVNTGGAPGVGKEGVTNSVLISGWHNVTPTVVDSMRYGKMWASPNMGAADGTSDDICAYLSVEVAAPDGTRTDRQVAIIRGRASDDAPENMRVRTAEFTSLLVERWNKHSELARKAGALDEILDTLYAEGPNTEWSSDTLTEVERIARWAMPRLEFGKGDRCYMTTISTTDNGMTVRMNGRKVEPGETVKADQFGEARDYGVAENLNYARCIDDVLPLKTWAVSPEHGVVSGSFDGGIMLARFFGPWDMKKVEEALVRATTPPAPCAVGDFLVYIEPRPGNGNVFRVEAVDMPEDQIDIVAVATVPTSPIRAGDRYAQKVTHIGTRYAVLNGKVEA